MIRLFAFLGFRTSEDLDIEIHDFLCRLISLPHESLQQTSIRQKVSRGYSIPATGDAWMVDVDTV